MLLGGDVTAELPSRVCDCIEILVAGIFAAEAGAPRRAARDREDELRHAGLLVLVLRIVVLIHCEERGLLPGKDGIQGLFYALAADHAAHPGAMVRRFDAFPRLVSRFRAVFRAETNLPPVDDATLHAALEKLLWQGGRRISYEALDAEQIGSVYEALMGFSARRRTGSHYTPRELTEPVVARTLEPLIEAMGDSPSSNSLLNLVICDPAVGSGAFLVAACRFLADRVVAAWTREGAIEVVASAHGDVLTHARRLVARRCLYGVDKNRDAVELARLSLWLVTMAPGEPFTFVDHGIRHGDSLVGLRADQIRAFHWKPRAPVDLLAEAFEAEDAPDRTRLFADLVVGAFFSRRNDREREKERQRRLARVAAWLAAEKRGDLGASEAILGELRSMQAEIRETHAPFHWTVEFPEIFRVGRPDPLAGDTTTGKAWVSAFVGNPPFRGGSGISSALGDGYRDWLLSLHEGAHGNSDLVAHFFRRAASLVGDHGAIGLISTNTIGQGDTRTTGLRYLVSRGFSIHRAEVDLPWPGDAAVVVSVVYLGVGRGRRSGAVLGGRPVIALSSRLRPTPERPDPVVLTSNVEKSFLGSKIYGQGFLLSPSEREELLGRDRRNATRIFPYIGGEETNRSPTQSFDRYVIHFGQMTLGEAEAFPHLLDIVREKVKPERDVNNRDVRRAYWWRFGEVAPALYAAIAPLSRCLVTSQVTRHLCFSFQPTDRIFAHTLYVFPLDAHSAFATLQSRIHEAWARLLSSSMKTDLRYAASDCFETFPFPTPDPLHVLPELEEIGERLYEARARTMIDTNQGLTKTYNALKDPRCEDRRILHLRDLHVEMDRRVLDAYGFRDITVPRYCALSDEDRAAAKRFEDEVVDRLFVLNAQRAAL